MQTEELKNPRFLKKNGLLYKILDENSKPVGVPIKASDFYSKPTLKFLVERFKVNEIKKESHKSHVKNAVRVAFLNENIISPEKLADRLEIEGIHLVLRKSKDGQLYGITYVDHVTHSVFDGSSLGKQYSAQGILDSCKQNISQSEKHNQRSISNSSENIPNLELKEYLKSNPIDILLRVENGNDYLLKQFKQKKRRRIRRGL